MTAHAKYKLLPVEPDQAQIDAAIAAWQVRIEKRNREGTLFNGGDPQKTFRATYAAFIEAAPDITQSPPTVDRAGVAELVVATGVFEHLLFALAADNGVEFQSTFEDRMMALPAIARMLKAGYFTDDPDDLDGDFWQMAAGEETERPQRFGRAPEAFIALDNVLHDIFERPFDEPVSTKASHMVPEGWLRAAHEAMARADLGVASASDTYSEAQEKLNTLLCYHVAGAVNAAPKAWKDPTGFSVAMIIDEANNWTRRETGKEMLLNYAAMLKAQKDSSND